MKYCNVAGDAINREPRTRLPDPVRCGIVGQSVIESKRGTDCERAVGDIVDLASRPFFLAIVDKERAHLQAAGLIRLGVRSGVRLSVGNLVIRPKSYRMNLR